MLAELKVGWGTALCVDFWGVRALTGGGAPVGGGPRGAPGWKVVGRGVFTKGGADPMETVVFHMTLKNLRKMPKQPFTEYK